MIIKHNQVFTHDKRQVILLFDRVLLSIDDINNDEFVFATMQDKNSKQTLYFVCKLDVYNQAKNTHKQVLLAGFWHSLFVNDKIDLTNDGIHHLITEELAYLLDYTDGDIESSFTVVSEINADITSNINTEIDHFEVLISPQDKIKAIKLKRNITIYSIVVFWALIGVFGYYYSIYQDSKQQETVSQINTFKKDAAVLGHKIIKQKQDVYAFDESLKSKIKALSFLRFKNISLLGDINLNQVITIKSNTDLSLLQSFVKKYPQYDLKRHAEALPTIEVKL